MDSLNNKPELISEFEGNHRLVGAVVETYTQDGWVIQNLICGHNSSGGFDIERSWILMTDEKVYKTERLSLSLEESKALMKKFLILG